MTIPQYVSDMMEGFEKTDPRYVDLGNHMGKSEEKILTEIPYEQLGKLNALRFLSIKHNQIKEIDARIGALTALDVLELSDNPLTEIAAEIGHCTNMKLFKAANIAKVNASERLDKMLNGMPGHQPTYLSEDNLKLLDDT